jgi:hypothetical protein
MPHISRRLTVYGKYAVDDRHLQSHCCDPKTARVEGYDKDVSFDNLRRITERIESIPAARALDATIIGPTHIPKPKKIQEIADTFFPRRRTYKLKDTGQFVAFPYIGGHFDKKILSMTGGYIDMSQGVIIRIIPGTKPYSPRK